MILQCNETLSAAHFLIVINYGSEPHAVDLVNEFRALGDDFHRIPFVLFEVRLNLLGIPALLYCLGAVRSQGGNLTGGSHQMAGLFLGMLLS